MSYFEVTNYAYAVAAPEFQGDKAMVMVTDGGSNSAMMHFRADGSTLPANDAANSYLYLSQLHDVVDMLRNESPIAYNYDDSTGAVALQTSGMENIGENDGTPEAGNSGVMA